MSTIEDGSKSDQLKLTENAAHVKLYGITSAGVQLPLKVVDDGSGYGKVSFSYE